MTLGNRISRLRREQKFSQEFIAESLNVSRQAVSKWENDLSSPDTENLIALAKLLEVDVEYLATGQLTEDMEPEPIPEMPAQQEPEKTKRSYKRFVGLLLAISILGNIALFCLWQYEKHSEELMEQLCASSAYSAKEHFADYAQRGAQSAYWQGVADFRSYMTGYLLLNGSGGDYIECNELYGNLVFEKDRVSIYVEELRKVMRLLSEDDELNAFLEMDRLNNLIEHGA